MNEIQFRQTQTAVIKVERMQKDLDKATVWRNTLVDQCDHVYPNGFSAVAPRLPNTFGYDVCKICGKLF